MSKFTTCRKCDVDIQAHEEYVSVTLSRERFDGEAVDVLDARMLYALCLSCSQVGESQSDVVLH